MKNNKSDKEIITEVIDELGIFSVTSFAEELGYSNGSSVFHLMRNMNGRKINEPFIKKVVKRYPQVNEHFLRGRSDKVLIASPTLIENSGYTLNDLPSLFSDLIKEQKETNKLLTLLLNK